jgi:intracellular sulfur oxidation DsrE/DsrF family protein
MNNKELSKEEIETLELCTNFAKQQINDLERKLKQSDMFISYEVERLQKELMEFKKCVNSFKRHLVEANLLMAACIIVIFIKVFFL